jgi:hypothetical protein
VYQEYGKEVPAAVNVDTTSVEDTDADDSDEGIGLGGWIFIVWMIFAIMFIVARFMYADEDQVNPYKGWVGRWFKEGYGPLGFIIMILSCFGDGDGGSFSGGGGGGSSGRWFIRRRRSEQVMPQDEQQQSKNSKFNKNSRCSKDGKR